MAAKNTVRRWVQIVFDRLSAKKAEGELASSMGAAGKKGGESFLREARAAFERRLADLKNQLAKGLIDPKQFKAQADLAAKEFNSGLLKGMEKARTAGTLTEREYLKLSRTLKTVGVDGAGAGGKLGAAFLKAGAALAAFLGFRTLLADSVRAALAAEDSVSRLDTVLQTLGLTYQQVSPRVEKYLDNLQKTTRFGDEDGREALVNLITATGNYDLSLRLLDVTAKIAEKRHTTMALAAQTAADASRGLTKGMTDLGISAKDTGDIVAKINANLGDLAVEGGKTSSGSLAILSNLLGEVKESFGDAILGADGFKGSVSELRTALVDLNTWVKDNGGTIRDFVSILVVGAKGIGKALAAGGTIQGSINRRIIQERADALKALNAPAVEGAQRVADQVAFTEQILRDLTEKGAKGRRTLTKEEEEAEEERQKKTKERAKALGAELQRIEEDVAVSRLQIEQGLTEALAREMVRRERLLSGTPERTSATTGDIEAGVRRRDELRTAVEVLEGGAGQDRLPQAIGDVGVKAGSAIPPVQELNRELFIQKELLAAGAPLGTEFADSIADMASRQWDAANNFSTPWIDALGLIRDEVEGQGTLFRELGEAWAEGGLAGLGRLAARKVKENLASALEMVAKGLGLAALGDPRAGAAFASAAQHGIAAIAWKAIAGGGGGGGASSTAGIGSGAPNLARGASMEKPGPDVSIYLTGPGFNALNPEVQKIVYGAQQNARERFGANAKIRIVRTP